MKKFPGVPLSSVRRPRSVLGVKGGREKKKAANQGWSAAAKLKKRLLSHLPAQTKPRKKQEGVLVAVSGESCLVHGNYSH